VFSDSKGWQAQKKWFFDRIVDRPREYSYPYHDVTLQIEAVAHGLKPQFQLKDLIVPSHKPATKKGQAGGTLRLIRRPTELAILQLDQLGTYDGPLPLIPFPSCKVYLLSNEKYQSGNENRTLSEATPRQQIKQYMQERHKWDKETFEKVKLDAYAAARRSNQRLERFSSRFAHGWLPTRIRMRTIGTAANDECIWCHDTETQDHLFQCPHQSVWRDEFVERLDKCRCTHRPLHVLPVSCSLLLVELRTLRWILIGRGHFPPDFGSFAALGPAPRGAHFGLLMRLLVAFPC
jgi:hypothetical protein